MDQKRTCLSINARNRDRISSLPDCLLHQILSFLDTKDAVLTGILSSRWETLWITNPNLSFCYKFDEYVDINKTPVPQYNQLYDLKKEGFSNSVRKVLDAQKGYETKKVVIDCDMMLESKLIYSVMAYAISHNAREIEIMFDCQEDRIEFPESMYTSRSLEKLKLMGDQYDLLYVTKSMGFQYLKELTLHRVDFSQRGFNEEIFPDCLCLEFLRLFACDIDGPVKISAPRVKKLEIVYPLNEKRFDRPSFQICTPMLSYFKYEGPYPLYFTMVGDCTSCLEEIDIDVQADLSKEGDVRTKYIIERLIKMFRECRNAKSVIISLKTLEILSTLPNLLKGQKSPFANLKNVHLKTNWSGLAPGWSFLLNKSPTVKISLQGDLNMVDVRRSSGNSS